MSKIVVIPADELEAMIKRAVGGGKAPAKKKAEEDFEEEDFGDDLGEVPEEEEPEEEADEVTAEDCQALVAKAIKAGKKETVSKIFKAVGVPSISKCPEKKLPALYARLKAIKLK